MTDPDIDSLLIPILHKLAAHSEGFLIIGGWVPQLYRRADGATSWKVTPLQTTELDVLLTGEHDASAVAGGSLATTLREIGFTPSGDPESTTVWERDIARGERIELFVDHPGTWADAHTTVSLGESGELRALALPGLRVLRDYSAVLRITIPAAKSSQESIDVRAPDLGIFALHKGEVFFRRPDNARKVKDLHYIVDLMQSGDRPVDRIEQDISRYCTEGGAAARLARLARNNVALLTNKDRLHPLLELLGEAIGERHGTTSDSGSARALGLLEDFLELIPSDCG